MKITIEIKTFLGEHIWKCSSDIPKIEAIGRTYEESFKNWKDSKWMHDNPQKVSDIGKTLLRDYFGSRDINYDKMPEAGSGVWVRND